jgi:hypothetical protein
MKFPQLALMAILVPFGAELLGAKPIASWRIVDFGIYATNPTDERVAAPGSSSGDLGVVAAEEFPMPVHHTTRVDAAMGLEFGFTFVNDGLDAFDIEPVQIRVEHPPIVSVDGNLVSMDSWEASAQGIPRFTGWKFERWEELVPGRWTVSVISNGSVALKQTFDVR